MDECVRTPLKNRRLALTPTRRGGIGLVREFPRTQNSAATSVCQTTVANAKLLQREMEIPDQTDKLEGERGDGQRTMVRRRAPGAMRARYKGEAR